MFDLSGLVRVLLIGYVIRVLQVSRVIELDRIGGRLSFFMSRFQNIVVFN